MRCHTSDHYLATSVPRGGRSSMFPCQVIIVLVLSRVRPIQIPPSLSLIVCTAQSGDMSQRLFTPTLLGHKHTTHSMGVSPFKYNQFDLLLLTV